MVLAEKRGRPFDTYSVGVAALGDRQHVGAIWGLANGAFYKFADEVAVQFRDPKVWTIVETVAQDLLSRGRMYADEFIGLLENLTPQLGVPFRLYSTVIPELQTPTLLPASS
ncbi:hypothetical protein J2793_007084 [Paraburkholderia caledonica]|uniref:Uncharacterized protein n=1 Tax=Paraburkholderia caledonica TaxID=134536 RepID=A0AB73INN1_9BURK|nr:hypothetical protein [Paraburkholderia caledonica]